MTKEQILEVIKLLSALESWSFANKNKLTDDLSERILVSMDVMTMELLK
jgi:hypothetical protein